MNFGLIQNLIQDARNYAMGTSKLPFIRYREDGDWTDSLPKYEPQAEDYETSGCTVWALQNQIETLYKYKYGEEPNYSERFNYILANVRPTVGIDPHITAQSIRENGLIDQRYLPVPATLWDFLQPRPMEGSHLARGQNWLMKHEYGYEDVWKRGEHMTIDEKTNLLKDALTTGPVAVSVSAWFLHPDGKYYDDGYKNNHLCMLYKVDAHGYYIFDSYDHTRKLLDLSHRIDLAIRIHLQRRDRRGGLKEISILNDVIERLRKMLMKPTLLDVCKAHLGTDASPADLAADELGCAETVTTILKKVYPDTPIMLGTYSLYEYLKNPANGWEQVTEPVPECVVVSPTGLGKAGTHGHTGFVLENGLIASNTSIGVNKGRFIQNYTVDSWKKYYGAMGYPQFYYKRKK